MNYSFEITRRKFLENTIHLGLYLLNMNSLNNSSVNDKTEKYNNIIEGNGIFTNIWVEPSIFNILMKFGIKYVFFDIGDVDKKTGRITTPRDQIETFMKNITLFEQQNGYYFKKFPWNVVIPQEGYLFNTNEFRDNYVNEYVNLVKDFHMDGIHVDIEAIPDEFKYEYLNMLEQLKMLLPENSILSVYGGSIIDEGVKSEWGWSESFLSDVLKNGADIVSIPTYDTWSLSEKNYRERIQNQIHRITKHKEGHFRYPIPTHKQAPELALFAFDEYLKGTYTYCNWPFLGVDLFATWTISNEDWKIFEEFLKAPGDTIYITRQFLKNIYCYFDSD